jgi:hypothetical protein
VISNGGGTRKTVLESTNTTGTQTWSGDITGDGSYSRGTGGNTVFAGQLVSVGGVTIADNSKIQLAQSPGSNRVIRTANLTIGSTNSQLDLTNNKLIVPGGDVGTASAGTYGGLSGLIQSAYNFGAWDGPSGITTSMPDAGPAVGLTTLGIATADEVFYAGGTFGGVPVASGDVLLMYTYAGDVNFDGLVDAADYGVIDNWVQFPGAFAYANGDFNYDGVIDAGDYGIIDNTIQLQGDPIPVNGAVAGAGLVGVATVPEPASLSVLGVAAASLLGHPFRRSRYAARLPRH